MKSVPRDIEAVLPEWLSRLITCKTVNPPGGEAPGAEVLSEILKNEGVECSVLEREPGRANLMASLGEDTGKPPLILLSHLDVVPSGDGQWRHPPFEGRIIEGSVWGRGAVDCLGVTVMHLGAFLSLYREMREGLKPERKIILIASADEENGSTLGAEFITGEVEELKKPAVVLTEGGGFSLRMNGQPWMVVTTGEKGRFRLKVTASGTGGHASCPPGGQAVEKLGRWLSNLGAYRWDMPVYETLDCFRTLIENKTFLDKGEMISRFRGYMENPGIYLDRVHAGGQALNVVPSSAVCECEIGVFPSWNEDYMRNCLEEITGDTGVEAEVVSFQPGFECAPGSQLFDEIEKGVIRQGGHYAGLLPILALGRTDGRFFGRNGSMSFGISPLLPDMPFSEVLKMVHQADEHISLDSLAFGTEVLTNIVYSLCGNT